MKLGRMPLKKCTKLKRKQEGDAAQPQGESPGPDAASDGDDVQDVDFEEVK